MALIKKLSRVVSLNRENTRFSPIYDQVKFGEIWRNPLSRHKCLTSYTTIIIYNYSALSWLFKHHSLYHNYYLASFVVYRLH